MMPNVSNARIASLIALLCLLLATSALGCGSGSTGETSLEHEGQRQAEETHVVVRKRGSEQSPHVVAVTVEQHGSRPPRLFPTHLSAPRGKLKIQFVNASLNKYGLIIKDSRGKMVQRVAPIPLGEAELRIPHLSKGVFQYQLSGSPFQTAGVLTVG